MPLIGFFTPHDLERIRNAINYIDTHYRLSFSVHQLSHAVNMNIKQLRTGIQLSTGLTIHRYQLKIRIDRAAIDLRDLYLPIKSIAFKHGFSSPSHLAKEFKKQTGQTPKEYRLKQLIKAII